MIRWDINRIFKVPIIDDSMAHGTCDGCMLHLLAWGLAAGVAARLG
jgi:hypothetical protein